MRRRARRGRGGDLLQHPAEGASSLEACQGITAAPRAMAVNAGAVPRSPKRYDPPIESARVAAATVQHCTLPTTMPLLHLAGGKSGSGNSRCVYPASARCSPVVLLVPVVFKKAMSVGSNVTWPLGPTGEPLLQRQNVCWWQLVGAQFNYTHSYARCWNEAQSAISHLCKSFPTLKRFQHSMGRPVCGGAV